MHPVQKMHKDMLDEMAELCSWIS